MQWYIIWYLVHLGNLYFVLCSGNKSTLMYCILIVLFWFSRFVYLLFSILIFSNCICPLCTFQQMLELSKNVRELKSILYGNSESEPVAEACTQLTQEFFREDTLRLLIKCLPKLNLEVSRMRPIACLGFYCEFFH